jgi:crossover junction endodeoxyribonuclease RuvC
MPVSGRVRILGIDPGSLRLGYGVIDKVGPGQLSYVECGIIAAPARLERAERLTVIGRGLREVLDELAPDEVAMEQAFYGKNVQSTLVLGEARGAVTFIVCDKGLTLAGYAPAKVKRTIVGHGAATKQQIGYLVRALLSLRRVPEPDAADALAIAICHARHRTLVAAGRAALEQETRPRRPRVR